MHTLGVLLGNNPGIGIENGLCRSHTSEASNFVTRLKEKKIFWENNTDDKILQELIKMIRGEKFIFISNSMVKENYTHSYKNSKTYRYEINNTE